MPRKKDAVLRGALLEKVKPALAIWDKVDKDHKETNMVTSAWIKIHGAMKDEFSELELSEHKMGSVDLISKMWQNLRTTYFSPEQ